MTLPQINDLIGWMRKNNNAACCLVQCFDVICEMMTWNLHIWDSNDNVNPQQKIFHSLPLHENHWCQASESTLYLVCTMWQTWNYRLTLKLAQSSISMQHFCCSSCHSFLNSIVIKNKFKTSLNKFTSIRSNQNLQTSSYNYIIIRYILVYFYANYVFTRDGNDNMKQKIAP